MGVESAVIFINGTVGVGKTTVADAMGEILQAKRIAHAIIDLDRIRWAWPAPPKDPFNHELELANLSSLVGNYAAAGIEMFVLAGVLEDAQEIPRYQKAVGGRPFVIARITADEATRKSRIKARHVDDPVGLEWHLHRTVELDRILNERCLHDVVIDSTHKVPTVVAEEIWGATYAHLEQAE